MITAALLLWLSARVNELDQFVGRDLSWGHLTKSEEAQLMKLTGKLPKSFSYPPMPQYVWKTERNYTKRYVILAVEDLLTIPGGSSACIQLYDTAGRRLRSECFQVGWRMSLTRAELQYSSELNCDMVVLETAPAVNGRNVKKEYYSLKNDRVMLVRLENDRGEATQNIYDLKDSEMGIRAKAKTVDEWSKLLLSSEAIEVLSALIFLGGRHLNEPFESNNDTEKIFLELMASDRIRGLIAGLSTSRSEWIAAAARLALRDPRDRPSFLD